MFELYSYEWIIANDESWSNDPPELNWHETYSEQYGNALGLVSNEQLVPISDEDLAPTQSPISSEALVPTPRPVVSGEDLVSTQPPVSQPVSDEEIVTTQQPPVSYGEDGLLSSSSHTVNITLTTLVSLVLYLVLLM